MGRLACLNGFDRRSVSFALDFLRTTVHKVINSAIIAGRHQTFGLGERRDKRRDIASECLSHSDNARIKPSNRRLTICY